MKRKKAWSGRFREGTDPVVEKFNASIGFDWRLSGHDIALSIAHATMLGQRKIIPQKDARQIVRGLKLVEGEIAEGKFSFDAADEDIHMAIERRLIQLIGPEAGGKLHTARSRNDQVATSFRMFVRAQIDEVVPLLRRLMRAMAEQAREHVDTVAPAYTHLQPAQPVRLAHWFLAYYDMFGRDVERFAQARKRMNVMPLGSAALAGTNFPIDRDWVAGKLGFDSVTSNSMDGVSDRDFALDFLYAASVTFVHLSRLSEELVLFTTSEFGLFELPDAYCTGSSIMPQKKNPDVPELVRGKTGRVVGGLMALLTTLKGLPMTYNKDLQEDKEPVFDAADQIKMALEVTAGAVERMKVNRKRLERRSWKGFMTAVDLADRLVMSGVPFREAHEMVGKLVGQCIDSGRNFSELSAADIVQLDPRLSAAVRKGVDPARSADGKDVKGGTARRRIMTRLRQIEKEMGKW